MGNSNKFCFPWSCPTRRLNRLFFYRLLYLAVLVLQYKKCTAGQFFEVQPGNTTVLLGESFTLYCRVANKSGVTYWEKDNNTFAVPGDGQFVGSDRWAVFGDIDNGEYNLQVIRTERMDEGVYVCKSTSSSSDGEEISSSPAWVTVRDTPSTGQSPICLTSTTGDLSEGDPVDFTCALAFVPVNDSNVEASLSWTRSGPRMSSNPLPTSETITRVGYVVRKITVAITISDHLATYTCNARRDTESQNRTCSTGALLVQHSPIIALSPTAIQTVEGTTANFSCILMSAYPKNITYEWYYKGRLITPSAESEERFVFGDLIDGRSLSVRDLTLLNDDGAQVVCIVRNSAGSGTARGVVTLTEPVFNLEREILIWLLPLGAIALVMILALLLAICVLDCKLLAQCCDKRKRNIQGPSTRTWSVANLAMTLRSRDPVDLNDEYFIARSIRSRENAGIRPDKNVDDRKVPLPENHVNPNFILEEKDETRQGTGEREKQRKTRSERDRLRKKSVENAYEEDTRKTGSDVGSSHNHYTQQGTDSGLEGMSSSRESNYSPTLGRLTNNVKEKQAMYAAVERNNLTNGQYRKNDRR